MISNKKLASKERKDGGIGLDITQKQIGKIISLLDETQNKHLSGDIDARNGLIKALLHRHRKEYMLEYSIWKFVKNNEKLSPPDSGSEDSYYRQ